VSCKFLIFSLNTVVEISVLSHEDPSTLVALHFYFSTLIVEVAVEVKIFDFCPTKVETLDFCSTVPPHMFKEKLKSHIPVALLAP
jgi:hypothetical protein